MRVSRAIPWGFIAAIIWMPIPAFALDWPHWMTTLSTFVIYFTVVLGVSGTQHEL